jgi:hypothetical protein
MEREDERGVAMRPDLNGLDVPEWAERHWTNQNGGIYCSAPPSMETAGGAWRRLAFFCHDLGRRACPLTGVPSSVGIYTPASPASAPPPVVRGSRRAAVG